MSKFDFLPFYGGYDSFAVSKQRYTKEEAIKIAKREYFYHDHGYMAVGEAYVRYRYGVDEDGERRSCWWMEYEENKRSCPCWVFHRAKTKDEPYKEGYEYIELDQ